LFFQLAKYCPSCFRDTLFQCGLLKKLGSVPPEIEEEVKEAPETAEPEVTSASEKPEEEEVENASEKPAEEEVESAPEKPEAEVQNAPQKVGELSDIDKERIDALLALEEWTVDKIASTFHEEELRRAARIYIESQREISRVAEEKEEEEEDSYELV